MDSLLEGETGAAGCVAAGALRAVLRGRFCVFLSGRVRMAVDVHAHPCQPVLRMCLASMLVLFD